MPLSVPNDLKKISPYIKRAEELDRDKANPESRLIAYYCRQYAVQLGIPIADSAPSKACLGELLEELEKEKPSMDNFTKEEAAFLCRKFAENVFKKADTDDRAGTASKHTAKAFYAAASFLQILEQFGGDDLESDKKKIIYCKWKATEILKAIKEGRTPTPGGYNEDEELQGDESDEEEEGDETADDEQAPPTVETVQEDEEEETELPMPPVFKPPPLPPVKPPSPPPAQTIVEDDESEEEGMEVELGPPPSYPAGTTETFQPAPSKPAKKSGMFGFGKKSSKQPSKAQFADATELTRFALAALEDKDADLAAQRLQQALSTLGR